MDQVASSRNWSDEVRLKIHQDAGGIYESTPPYFRRFDAFGNKDYPSIFKRQHKANRNHGAVAATSLHRLATPTLTAPQPQPSPEAAGGETSQHQVVADRGPVVVSVGPYHQSSPAGTSPPLITRAKKCGIVKFLERPLFGLDASDFLRWARGEEAEERVRSYYVRDSFSVTSEELAEMLLLDGCLLLFAVFLLRTSVSEDQRPALLSQDTVHGKEFNYLSADITLHMKQTRLDLLMLDNQIPFFVLEELHRRLKRTLFCNVNHNIQELAISCFDSIHPSPVRPPQHSHTGAGAAEDGQLPPTVHHLLHLFHLSRVPTGKHEVKISSIIPKEPEHHLPSATELKESLTCFKKTRSGSYSLDIVFKSKLLGTRGVMAIPALSIHGYSESIFRDLIALEQNHLNCGLGVTVYSMCMARLLQSEDDAKVLRKSGILMHTQKTDKEIVDFFRGLKDEYKDTLMPDDLLELCKNVAAHKQRRAGRMIKWIERQCFPKQTVTFFVIFGAVISVATLVNTVHSMYRYYHPFKGSGSFYSP